MPPNVDAIEYAVKVLDKTTKLEVKYINYFKGMFYLFQTNFIYIIFFLARRVKSCFYNVYGLIIVSYSQCLEYRVSKKRKETLLYVYMCARSRGVCHH